MWAYVTIIGWFVSGSMIASPFLIRNSCIGGRRIVERKCYAIFLEVGCPHLGVC